MYTYMDVLSEINLIIIIIIISIEATSLEGAWRCLYAQPRCPASFYWEMAICYPSTADFSRDFTGLWFSL